MKVLALNGSPRTTKSSTFHIMQHFLAGMEAAGAKTEVIHLRKLQIEHCIGCYTCWVKTPGVCVHKDDMPKVLEKFNDADMVIFGTPLYHFTMTGIMKDCIDRLLPRVEPWLIPHPRVPDVAGHPERVHKPDKMFLISAAGFPEFAHFSSLVATFKHIARMEGWGYVGEILRPYAEPLHRDDLQGMFALYYDRVRQAGEEVARDGRISGDLKVKLCENLFPGDKQAHYDMSTAYWNERMDRNKVPQELRHTVPLDTMVSQHSAGNTDCQPDELVAEVPTASDPAKETQNTGELTMHMSDLTCREILAGMPTAFNAEAAGGMVAEIYFRVTGEEPGDYYLVIANGTCTFHEGTPASPKLTIETPSEVWVAISQGELDGQQAFMESKYRASGDFGLLMKLSSLFKTG